MTASTRTHCRRGHALTEANTVVDTDGWARCLQCRRDQNAKQRRAYTVHGFTHHRSLEARDAVGRRQLHQANARFVDLLRAYADRHDDEPAKWLRATMIEPPGGRDAPRCEGA